MSGRYDDIINLPHHVSPKRNRMSMIDRAAQFSPFAALTGYDACIQESRRLTDQQIILDIDGKNMLDEKLCRLAEHIKEQPQVTITYFVPDKRKTGGRYVEVSGRVKKLNHHEKCILMEDGTQICFESIYEIEPFSCE